MKYFLYFLTAFVIVSCSNDKNEKTVVKEINSAVPNILLPELLSVEYLVSIDTSGSDSWQKTFDSKAFLSEFRKNVYSGNIFIYSPFYSDTNQARIPVKNLEAELGKLTDANSFNWGQYKNYSLGFIEKWNFDTASMQFIKYTDWWYPGFFSQSDSSYHRVFHVFSTEANDLMAENVIYELRFDDRNSNFRYMDHTRFFTWLVNKALSGNLQVYAPDNCNTRIDVPNLKQRLGEEVFKVADQDSSGAMVSSTGIQKMNLDELKGIIFIEDWYYDKKTGSISKKVTGFAPVRYYEDENMNSLKSIPFVIYTGNKKVSIL